MLVIDKISRTPIYEQIVTNIEREIATGLMVENDKLPSVRELSVLLDANPNTVQKAFTELDRAGIVVSSPGKGCYVAPTAREAIRARSQCKLDEITAIARDLLYVGFTKQELLAAIERADSENTFKNIK